MRCTAWCVADGGKPDLLPIACLIIAMVPTPAHHRQCRSGDERLDRKNEKKSHTHSCRVAIDPLMQ
jgi:hypothetical protein